MGFVASAVLAAGVAVEWKPGFAQDEYVMPESMTNALHASVRLDELERKVDVLYAAHTNALVRAERRKEEPEKRKSAVDRVKENMKMRRRRSVIPKSAGGVK